MNQWQPSSKPESVRQYSVPNSDTLSIEKIWWWITLVRNNINKIDRKVSGLFLLSVLNPQDAHVILRPFMPAQSTDQWLNDETIVNTIQVLFSEYENVCVINPQVLHHAHVKGDLSLLRYDPDALYLLLLCHTENCWFFIVVDIALAWLTVYGTVSKPIPIKEFVYSSFMQVFPRLEIKTDKVQVIHLEVSRGAMLISFVSYSQQILAF